MFWIVCLALFFGYFGWQDRAVTGAAWRGVFAKLATGKQRPGK